MENNDVNQTQRGFITSIERLNKTLKKLNKESMKENTASALSDNMQSLSNEMKKNFNVIKDYKRMESPILSAVKENLTDKKKSMGEALKATNIFRKLFGVKSGSGTLVDAIVQGFEARRSKDERKKEFRKDYAKFNKDGQIASETLSKKEFNEKSDALFSEILKKEAELASANADVLRGLESEFGRANDADLDRQARLEQELALLKSPGYGDTAAELDDRYRRRPDIESESLKEQESDENREEQSKQQKEQIDLLKVIAGNTGEGDVNPNDTEGKKSKKGLLGMLFGGLLGGLGGGIKKFGTMFLGGLFKLLKVGLLTAFRLLFSPRILLGAISKVFVPAMIIGSIVGGLMDGFEAWKETGSIKEALLSGLGGVLKFLSFGLFDKETIEAGITVAKEFVNDYIITPFNNMFAWLSETFTEYIINPITDVVNKIKAFATNIIAWVDTLIPKQFLKDVNKNIGDAKKFLNISEKNTMSPEAYKQKYPLIPAEIIREKTMELKNKSADKVSNNNIVNAPTTITKQVSNNHIKETTKNPDSTYMNFTRRNAAY